MSSLIIETGYLSKIEDHPNADFMKIGYWKGWPCCVGLNMTTETLVTYFQPDTLITHELASFLGVTPYLKKLGKEYPNLEKWAGRVGVARMRGVSSYGIIAPIFEEWLPYIDNLQEYLDIGKYDPPENITSEDAHQDSIYFHKYIDIENLRNYPDTFKENEIVIVTEKIHGNNCRVGYCPESDGDNWKWMAGSYSIRRREILPESDKVSLYWQPFTWCEDLKKMIEAIHVRSDCASVVVFGEIFGPGIQDFTYGLKDSEKEFRVFDISVNGEYLDYSGVKFYCELYGIPMVPILYHGPFDWEIMENLAEGETTMYNVRQIREGIVIRPNIEENTLKGRKIAKMIGFGYLNRKDGTENH